MNWIRNVMLTGGVLLLTAVPASADLSYFVAPMYGTTFGGIVQNRNKTAIGAQAGVLTGGLTGFEFDYARIGKIGDANDNFHTISGTFLFAPTRGNASLRPYLAVGGGIMAAIDKNASVYGFGSNAVNRTNVINAGGGVFVVLSGHFGVRLDARYFRALVAEQAATNSASAAPHFMRVGLGLVLEF